MQSGSGAESRADHESERLVSEHGEEADDIAARRADALFRNGDTLGGARWLKIFRRIAMAHRRRTVE
jgi:hypothetical protein